MGGGGEAVGLGGGERGEGEKVPVLLIPVFFSA